MPIPIQYSFTINTKWLCPSCFKTNTASKKSDLKNVKSTHHENKLTEPYRASHM